MIIPILDLLKSPENTNEEKIMNNNSDSDNDEAKPERRNGQWRPMIQWWPMKKNDNVWMKADNGQVTDPGGRNDYEPDGSRSNDNEKRNDQWRRPVLKAKEVMIDMSDIEVWWRVNNEAIMIFW